ncbi:NifB/NifX family molybdenum-iron cluster-binding protein [Desulfovirgula thermocuniculi]|uniref:NifB/NifX family molybdenum-iron cluster-binding protein n=1 Tax=Desulfovirgula thermocuniculi TaxID=348842 RepID=UPI00146FC402|nr:NifB/NifX family molybdenum-iron cluster-binding protein [Desulfovirgula thermocuniculi]
MKVAIPNNHGEVHQDLGRCDEFVIYEIREGEVKGGELLTIPNGQNYKGALWTLREKGVTAIICGNVGPGSARALASYGFHVIPQKSGRVEHVLHAFLKGELTGRLPTCQPCYAVRQGGGEE